MPDMKCPQCGNLLRNFSGRGYCDSCGVALGITSQPSSGVRKFVSGLGGATVILAVNGYRKSGDPINIVMGLLGLFTAVLGPSVVEGMNRMFVRMRGGAIKAGDRVAEGGVVGIAAGAWQGFNSRVIRPILYGRRGQK